MGKRRKKSRTCVTPLTIILLHNTIYYYNVHTHRNGYNVTADDRVRVFRNRTRSRISLLAGRRASAVSHIMSRRCANPIPCSSSFPYTRRTRFRIITTKGQSHVVLYILLYILLYGYSTAKCGEITEIAGVLYSGRGERLGVYALTIHIYIYTCIMCIATRTQSDGIYIHFRY